MSAVLPEGLSPAHSWATSRGRAQRPRGWQASRDSGCLQGVVNWLIGAITLRTLLRRRRRASAGCDGRRDGRWDRRRRRRGRSRHRRRARLVRKRGKRRQLVDADRDHRLGLLADWTDGHRASCARRRLRVRQGRRAAGDAQAIARRAQTVVPVRLPDLQLAREGVRTLAVAMVGSGGGEHGEVRRAHSGHRPSGRGWGSREWAHAFGRSVGARRRRRRTSRPRCDQRHRPRAFAVALGVSAFLIALLPVDEPGRLGELADRELRGSGELRALRRSRRRARSVR